MHKPQIAQKRPIFIGCEGRSEVGYVGLLQDLVRKAGLAVHLEAHELAPGAGDPLARIEMAVRWLKHIEKTRIAPAERFVLLDFDQAERDPCRADRASRTAADKRISIIWQRPCFEAMLLRHLQGRETHRPADTAHAFKALRREWPDYEKPMTRVALAERIDRSAVLRAASVEPDLAALLRCIGIAQAD